MKVDIRMFDGGQDQPKARRRPVLDFATGGCGPLLASIVKWLIAISTARGMQVIRQAFGLRACAAHFWSLVPRGSE